MRRPVICLLILVCLACLIAPGARGAEVGQLAFVSQRDPALSRIPYWSDTYGDSGCGPASIANALIAAGRLTDPEESAALAVDLLRLMSPRHQPAGHQIDPKALRYLCLSPEARSPSWSDFPVLNSFLDAMAGHILRGDVTPESAALAAEGSVLPLLLTGDGVPTADLGDIVGAADRLHALGRDDAWLILARVSVGTEPSYSPMSYGKNGHFVTLIIPVGEYAESGAVYSVDSLPRSLGGEEDARYAARYPLALEKWYLHRELKRYRERWKAERESEHALRFTPTGEAKADLALFLQGTGSDPRAADLRRLGLYGRCIAFLSLPAAPNDAAPATPADLSSEP